MISPRMFFLALPVVFLACFAGSCDHTVLSGTVHGPSQLRVGVPAPLTLEVPGELDAIHWEYWQVSPEGAGRFEPAPDQEKGQGRQVTFIPQASGEAVIRVYGFFRQTNPQPITEQRITILP